MPIELTVDVTEAVGIGEPLQTRATVVLPAPDAVREPPVVCFTFPGAGYSRGYYTFDMPDSDDGGEAGWHAARGWIVVSCDHLCVGESSTPTDPSVVTFEHIAAANHATVTQVLRLLADGAVADGFPPVREPTVLGFGQSMGGCFTIVQQGHHATYDGIAVLGFSAIQTVLWMPAGAPARGAMYIPRGSTAVLTTPSEGDDAAFFAPDESGMPVIMPGFHYDDVPREVVERDMVDYPARRGDLPEWGSATIPACSMSLLSPGVVAPEAAVIGVPVLIAMGERDVSPNPRDEPRAYPHSPDITLVVVPRMAHMHNMASTRQQLWQRLHSWGEGVAAAR